MLTGRVRLDPTLFFTLASDTSRHGHIYKLYKQHAPRRVREQLFGICIMNEWNNLPGWVVDAKDLDKFKHNLDTHWLARQAVSNTVPIMFPVMKITKELAITGSAF